MCAGTTAAAQESSSCESLIKTDLFAVTHPAHVSRGKAETPVHERNGGGDGGGGGGGGGGDGGVTGNRVYRGKSSGGGNDDLSRLTRAGLAVRAPTLAEFVSGDMLLGPAKFWRWLAVDDAFGRTPVEKEGGEGGGGEGGQEERGAIAGGGK